MQKNKPLIIFDWNGTLLDDLLAGWHTILRILQEWELPMISLEWYRNHFGFPLQDFYTRMGFQWNDTQFGALSKRYMELYHQELPVCQLHAGAYDFIAWAKEYFRLGILSAYRKERLLDAVAAKGLPKEWFVFIEGIDNDLAASKSHLLEPLLQEHLAGAQGFFVGDTTHDYELAVQGKLTPIMYTMGHQSAELLDIRTSCALQFNSFKELKQYFEKYLKGDFNQRLGYFK
jgi:phosphoglycolate phosphatase